MDRTHPLRPSERGVRRNLQATEDGTLYKSTGRKIGFVQGNLKISPTAGDEHKPSFRRAVGIAKEKSAVKMRRPRPVQKTYRPLSFVRGDENA